MFVPANPNSKVGAELLRLDAAAGQCQWCPNGTFNPAPGTSQCTTCAEGRLSTRCAPARGTRSRFRLYPVVPSLCARTLVSLLKRLIDSSPAPSQRVVHPLPFWSLMCRPDISSAHAQRPLVRQREGAAVGAVGTAVVLRPSPCCWLCRCLSLVCSFVTSRPPAAPALLITRRHPPNDTKNFYRCSNPKFCLAQPPKQTFVQKLNATLTKANNVIMRGRYPDGKKPLPGFVQRALRPARERLEVIFKGLSAALTTATSNKSSPEANKAASFGANLNKTCKAAQAILRVTATDGGVKLLADISASSTGTINKNTTQSIQRLSKVETQVSALGTALGAVCKGGLLSLPASSVASANRTLARQKGPAAQAAVRAVSLIVAANGTCRDAMALLTLAEEQPTAVIPLIAAGAAAAALNSQSLSAAATTRAVLVRLNSTVCQELVNVTVPALLSVVVAAAQEIAGSAAVPSPGAQRPPAATIPALLPPLPPPRPASTGRRRLFQGDSASSSSSTSSSDGYSTSTSSESSDTTGDSEDEASFESEVSSTTTVGNGTGTPGDDQDPPATESAAGDLSSSSSAALALDTESSSEGPSSSAFSSGAGTTATTTAIGGEGTEGYYGDAGGDDAGGDDAGVDGNSTAYDYVPSFPEGDGFGDESPPAPNGPPAPPIDDGVNGTNATLAAGNGTTRAVILIRHSPPPPRPPAPRPPSPPPNPAWQQTLQVRLGPACSLLAPGTGNLTASASLATLRSRLVEICSDTREQPPRAFPQVLNALSNTCAVVAAGAPAALVAPPPSLGVVCALASLVEQNRTVCPAATAQVLRSTNATTILGTLVPSGKGAAKKGLLAKLNATCDAVAALLTTDSCTRGALRQSAVLGLQSLDTAMLDRVVVSAVRPLLAYLAEICNKTEVTASAGIAVAPPPPVPSARASNATRAARTLLGGPVSASAAPAAVGVAASGSLSFPGNLKGVCVAVAQLPTAPTPAQVVAWVALQNLTALFVELDGSCRSLRSLNKTALASLVSELDLQQAAKQGLKAAWEYAADRVKSLVKGKKYAPIVLRALGFAAAERDATVDALFRPPPPPDPLFLYLGSGGKCKKGCVVLCAAAAGLAARSLRCGGRPFCD